MKRKKALSILIAAAMALSATGCGGGSSANNTAVEMRVQRQVGTVSLSNEKGESVTLLEKMRLNAGHNLNTAKESLVTVSMDETRILTLGEEGEASVKQDGNTLRFEVTKGTALVGLTEELKDDQAVEVRSGNMICGFRGTYVEYADKNNIKVPNNKTKTILVLESKKPNGVEVKALDANGNEAEKINVGAGEKVVLKIDNPPASQGQSQSRVSVDLSGSGTQGVLEKSKCNLEDFSATTLNAIPQQEGLIKSVSETFGLQESDTKELVSLFSQTGTNDGDSGASLPLFGEQAQAMENAAKATKDTTGSETKAEIAVLKGTRDVMNEAVKKGLSDADMASVTENANEQMNGIAKAAKDAGAQGDGLAEIAKVASGQIVEAAGAGIDGGLAAGDVNGLINASGDGLSRIFTAGGTGGLQATSFDSQRALNLINEEVSRQKSVIDSLKEGLRERVGGTDRGTNNAQLTIDQLRNTPALQPVVNPANVQPTPAPTPAPAVEPEPEPTPEPVAAVDDDDDDDDSYYYSSSSSSSSSSQLAVTTYGIRVRRNLIYNGQIVTSNGVLLPGSISRNVATYNIQGAIKQEDESYEAAAGANVTISINKPSSVNLPRLKAFSGSNPLYPFIENGVKYTVAGGPGVEPSEAAITITMPASEVIAEVDLVINDRTVYLAQSTAEVFTTYDASTGELSGAVTHGVQNEALASGALTYYIKTVRSSAVRCYTIEENSNNVTPIEATKVDNDGYIWKIETNKPVLWINPQPRN